MFLYYFKNKMKTGNKNNACVLMSVGARASTSFVINEDTTLVKKYRYSYPLLLIIECLWANGATVYLHF
jgi:hypothetical protein